MNRMTFILDFGLRILELTHFQSAFRIPNLILSHIPYLISQIPYLASRIPHSRLKRFPPENHRD
jgi:hypothetical protein